MAKLMGDGLGDVGRSEQVVQEGVSVPRVASVSSAAEGLHGLE